ncbi:hypothetical protein Nepgr_030412 [Nepenthes gracilis]|uniref:Uncharacterized protein n=1 Tax=Nepenthes gracilis TaxID=150966 RepID=A0AAD3TG32_NEPGR|nr:hypothetical protein Nepgr_030412 [Nepenthes gracilis]
MNVQDHCVFLQVSEVAELKVLYILVEWSEGELLMAFDSAYTEGQCEYALHRNKICWPTIFPSYPYFNRQNATLYRRKMLHP